MTNFMKFMFLTGMAKEVSREDNEDTIIINWVFRRWHPLSILLTIGIFIYCTLKYLYEGVKETHSQSKEIYYCTVDKPLNPEDNAEN